LRFPDGSGGAARIAQGGGVFRAGPWSGPPPAGGWRAAFSLFASEAPNAPPVLGTYALEDGEILFRPRFPPSPAIRLRAVFRPPAGAPVTAWFGGVPAPERAPTTRIVSVTPSASVWPENVLRLYVTFSAPMRMGVAWDHIRMLDADGRPMGGMFVQFDQELWDPTGRRLTVLFDPARIKRGLVDNIDEGPPLREGETCRLEIDASWRDAAGGLLAAPLRRTIVVGQPLRAALDPADWRLTPPAGPRERLVIDFPHALDAALALRAFSVTREGSAVQCASELAADDTRLMLTPQKPWRPGRYRVEADPVLEDIAGNRIGRPFEIEATTAGPRPQARPARLSFDV
jgi:hypothetical protein